MFPKKVGKKRNKPLCRVEKYFRQRVLGPSGGPGVSCIAWSAGEGGRSLRRWRRVISLAKEKKINQSARQVSGIAVSEVWTDWTLVVALLPVFPHAPTKLDVESSEIEAVEASLRDSRDGQQRLYDLGSAS